MKNKIIVCVVFILYSSFLGLTQTKTEMQIQIDKQIKTIDSLNLIIQNQTNIIENRDRSIQFLKKDVEDSKVENENLSGKIRQKNSEISQLRNQNKLGVAKKVTMNNTRPSWTVPAGKHWVINQFISDYIADLITDSTGNLVGKEIHVFMKSINNVTLTDVSKNQLGPQIYSSITSNHTIQLPIVLTENTNFSIVVYKGNLNALELCDVNVICTYFEKDN